LSFATSDRGLSAEELKLQVLDYNSVRSHVVIGEATVSLSSLCTLPLGKISQVTVELKDTKGARAGEVALEVRLDLSRDIFVKKIACSELKNVEFFGSNDPYVKFEFGTWSDQTEYQDGAGAEAVWEDPHISFQATARALAKEPLQLSVMDYNHVTSHVLIGSAVVHMETLLQAEHTGDQVSRLKTDIVDKRGKKTGVVELWMRMHNPETDFGSTTAKEDDAGEGGTGLDDESATAVSVVSASAMEADLRAEAFRVISEIRILSDWGGNWRLMAKPSSNTIYTAAMVIIKDYMSYSGQDPMHFATIFANDKKRIASETSVRALQILKNLSSASITGVYVTQSEFCVLQAVRSSVCMFSLSFHVKYYFIT
jgi:hypothetical protein